MRFLAIMLVAAFVATSAASAAEQKRSGKARLEFQRENPCPGNGERRGPCPGWVIDHVIPLACGGADAPENMQWQTKKAAREKDKWERKGCEHERGQQWH